MYIICILNFAYYYILLQDTVTGKVEKNNNNSNTFYLQFVNIN